MRGNGENIELLMVVAALLLLAWGCVAIIRGICRWFLSLWAKPIPVPEQSEIDAARRLLETPRPVVGGSEWMKYECKPVMCEAPARQEELVVHLRNDPAHLATCAECRGERKFRGDAISYKAN